MILLQSNDIYIHTYMCIYMLIYIHTYICVCVCIYIFWPRHAACGIFVLQRGIEPASPAVEAQSLNLLDPQGSLESDDINSEKNNVSCHS